MQIALKPEQFLAIKIGDLQYVFMTSTRALPADAPVSRNKT